MDSIAHELRELRGEVRDLTGTVGELKTAVGDLSEGVGGAFTEARKAAEHVAALVPRVTAVETTCRLISAEVDKLVRASHPPIVLVSPQIRAALKRLTSSYVPQLIVLSYNEITRDTRIESTAVVADAS